MFFEHKALYRSMTAEVPEGYYTTPIGQAAIARPGSDLTIITYGMGVHWALQAVEDTGINAEIIDLRTLAPIDWETISESVQKTNRALVLHEDTMMGGIGADIGAWIGEHLFQSLDAPVMRVASLDMPIPFAKSLEQLFLPPDRLRKKMQHLANF